jgi:hypothetical protein
MADFGSINLDDFFYPKAQFGSPDKMKSWGSKKVDTKGMRLPQNEYVSTIPRGHGGLDPGNTIDQIIKANDDQPMDGGYDPNGDPELAGKWKSIDAAPKDTLGKTEWNQEGADTATNILRTAAQFTPYSAVNIPIAVDDYKTAIENGDTKSAVLAAAQVIPGGAAATKLGTTFFGGPSAYMLKQLRKGDFMNRATEKAIKHGGKIAIGANVAQVGNDLNVVDRLKQWANY